MKHFGKALVVSGDTWRLANRYVAKVGPIPENFQIQKKPSGKQ
jgi:hypothetical protein